MEKIDPAWITENIISLIGREWMLVTAGDASRFNTMTASWGGVGYLWNKPVVFVFVRPERYTFEFIERCDCFTLSFLCEEYREAYKVCGSRSGRDTDKVKEAGLVPFVTPLGNVTFEQSRLTLECRKLYTGIGRRPSVVRGRDRGQLDQVSRPSAVFAGFARIPVPGKSVVFTLICLVY